MILTESGGVFCTYRNCLHHFEYKTNRKRKFRDVCVLSITQHSIKRTIENCPFVRSLERTIRCANADLAYLMNSK